MKFNLPDYVILIVEDLDITLRFYTEVLGLKLGHRSGDYAQMDTGSTRLAFYTRSAMSETIGISLIKPCENMKAFEIGFKVENVDETYKMLLKKGIKGLAPPKTQDWGQRTAYVADPDGNLIELVENQKAYR